MFDMIKSNPILWLVIFLAVVSPSFLFGAVQVVLYIILGIFLLLLILGWVFNARVKVLRSQMEDQMKNGGAQNPFNQYTKREKTQSQEGDVKIFTSQQTTQKKVRKDVGDYVDFEEIKK